MTENATEAGLTIPTIHLNGTSREALAAALEHACNVLHDAQAAVAETAPNARDYYPQGPDAFERAREEHQARAERIRDVRLELYAIWEAIAP